MRRRVLNCLEDGDNISGSLLLVNTRRAYFPYGTSGHRLDLYIIHDGIALGADSCCLVKRYTKNTKDIRLRVFFPAKTLGGTSASLGQYSHLVNLEHQNDSGTSSLIDDIDVTIDVEEGIADPSGAIRLAFRSYSTAGVENTVTTAHRWGRVRLAGRLGANSNYHVKAYVAPATPGVLALDPGLSSLIATGSQGYLLPGFLIKTAVDKAFAIKTGNLTTSALKLPIPLLDNLVWAFKLKIYAEVRSDSATSSASSKMHYIEDIVGGYSLATGSANSAVIQNDRIHEKAWNGSNLTVTYSGGTSEFTITFGGSDYNVSTALARVEMEWVSRPAVG